MLRIRRQKGEQTHYATAVQPGGSVSGWDRNPARAVAITQAVASRVEAFYANNVNAGRLFFEVVDATELQLAQAVVAADGVGAEEFARLQEQYKRLGDEAAELRQRVVTAENAAVKAEQWAREAGQHAETIGDELVSKSDQVATLTARIADLEAQVAQGQTQQGQGKRHK